MKLFYSDTSPYARKVRLVVHEKGLQGQVQEVRCNPFDDLPELRAANPLGRVPTLVTGVGTALYDSPVICQYLDGLSDAPRLIPADGVERWRVLCTEALMDGLMDAAYDLVMERRRPPQLQSADWQAHWQGEIRRALAALERDAPAAGQPPRLSHLAIAAALGYLDLRLPELAWRTVCPGTAQWMAVFERRASVRATRPP
jgi:glutathione S-transferase